MTTSKAIIDRNVRNSIISDLGISEKENYTRVGNQSFYTIIADDNNNDRLVEVRIIVGKFDEDETAQERLDGIVEEKRIKEANAEVAKQKREEKAKKDAEKRKKKKEEEEEE